MVGNLRAARYARCASVVSVVVRRINVIETLRQQIAARTFLSEKQYGLAISYCMSAEDWPALGRIVECVLEEYVQQGESALILLDRRFTICSLTDFGVTRRCDLRSSGSEHNAVEGGIH